MSERERDTSHLISQTIGKRLSQRNAAHRPGIGSPRFRRLVKAWKQRGPRCTLIVFIDTATGRLSGQ